MKIEKFLGVFERKLGVNFYKKQRLENISSYFREVEEDNDIEFSDNDECLSYIIEYLNKNEDNSDTILDEIIRVLELSVTNRNPYYVMEFTNQRTFEELCEKFNEIFGAAFNFENVHFVKNGEMQCDDINNIIEIEFDYKELEEDLVNDREIRKSIGVIKLRFDLNAKKIISSVAGNRKIHNSMYKYLVRNSINVNPLYLLKRASTIKNKNHTEFAPTTLIFMNLLFNSFKQMNLNFDLEILDFVNVEAVNIQGMTLKGTKLLSAPEILHRIHNGDEIMKFKVNVDKILDNNGQQSYYSTNFEVNLEGKLCFVFDANEEDNLEKNKLICNIYDELLKLIYSDNTVEEGMKIINDNLPKPKSMQNIVSEIYHVVNSTVKSVDEKIAIEKYFIETFPLIRLKN